eukprot:gene6046-6499_t
MSGYKTTYTSRYGGVGGHEFTDTYSDLGGRGKITQIFVRSGSKVDKLTTVFADGGSVQEVIEFDDDEYVTKVTLRCGEKLDQITFYTNKNNQFGPYGGSGGHAETVTFPTGKYLQYFEGRCGEMVDAICFAIGDMLPKKDAKIRKFGSKGSSEGDTWDDFASLNHVLHSIKKISVDYDEEKGITQIAVTYTADSEDVTLLHGAGSKPTGIEFDLNSGEYVSAVEVRTSSQVNGIQFTLNSGRRSMWYGNKAGDSSTFTTDKDGQSCVCAFYGRAGDGLIYALGVFTVSKVAVKVVVKSVTFDDRSFISQVIGSGSLTSAQLTNNTDIDQVVSEAHSFNYTTSSTTTIQNSWSASVEITFETGVSFVKDNVKVGYTMGQTVTQATTVTTSVTDTYTFNVGVPAGASVYGECFANYYKSQIAWTGKGDIYYNIGDSDKDQDVSGVLDGVDIADVKATYQQM